MKELGVGSWLQNFDVILAPNPYLAVSLCCYLTPLDLGGIVRTGVEVTFCVAFLLFQQNFVININCFRSSFMMLASCCCDGCAFA